VVAIVVTLAVVVALMGVLVTGLLRSHADILRALHQLGAGVGDPESDGADAGHHLGVPVRMGPTLPPERGAGAHDVAGVTPSGDALAIGVSRAGHATLLAFLSSGCTSCQTFWQALSVDPPPGLPQGIRPVIVTKGPELEIPAEVAARAPRAVPVVMSTQAWSDYEVPASPFFVLVDGASGRRVGEGVANHFPQVADLVRRAVGDDTRAGRLDGPAREADNDEALRRAGILPGDPSLYPGSLDDIFSGTAVGTGHKAAVHGAPVHQGGD
jgi:hypothetical protein